MKVLKVIHGYPPHYMAGSEVYSFNLVNSLKDMADVAVFSRIENPFKTRYEVDLDVQDTVPVYRINKPQMNYRLQEVYLDPDVDEQFRSLINSIKPDIIHFGHLSHLSANLPIIAKEEFGLPVVYTIHDFWLYCSRGQMWDEWMRVCTKLDEEACIQCLRVKYRACLTEETYREYRQFMAKVIDCVDVFLSPSEFLRDFFIAQGVPEERIILSNYGFDKKLIRYRKRTFSPNEPITFGFLGRIIPSKGVSQMIDAFSRAETENSRLLIYGDAGKYARFLNPSSERIEFKGVFDNREIGSILDGIDVLIVPSLWYENSPLVIQEAFLAGVPVITSDLGGMRELVKHGIDGYTFPAGDVVSLSRLLTSINNDPTILNELSIDTNKVRSIEDDAKSVYEIYRKLIV